MTREDVSRAISEGGLIPIFSHDEFNVCRNVMMACYEGGIKVFEFTNRGNFSPELFQRLSDYAAERSPDLILATGSIVDSVTAENYIQSGAKVIVSPLLNEDVAKTCADQETPWIPGCATLTEISRGTELGAALIKIFPGNVLGPEFIKAVKAPCPWFKLMPTGGVTAERENLSAWFRAGAEAVGMGSQLIDRSWVAAKDYDKIRTTVKSVLSTIEEIRQA